MESDTVDGTLLPIVPAPANRQERRRRAIVVNIGHPSGEWAWKPWYRSLADFARDNKEIGYNSVERILKVYGVEGEKFETIL